MLGALVRATGSGDACGDDWPVCNGRWIPELDANVLIEYVHRLATPVLVGLTGWLVVIAVRRYRSDRRVLLPAVAAFALLFVQAGLGAVVVRTKLSPELVTAHLATAMLLVAALVLATAGAWTMGRRRGGGSVLPWVAAAIVYAAILVGAFVRGEGAGLAFEDWPLMDGRALPAVEWGAGQLAHFLHRVVALLSLGAVAWVTVAAWRRRAERGSAAALAAAALVAVSLQVIVGAVNVWTGLAVAARVAHVALAAVTWAGIVASAALQRIEAAA